MEWSHCVCASPIRVEKQYCGFGREGVSREASLWTEDVQNKHEYAVSEFAQVDDV